MDDHVSLFVALADVFDCASAALNDAIHVSIAIPLAAKLVMRESCEPDYENRVELRRLEAVFQAVASKNSEFLELTKAGRAVLEKVLVLRSLFVSADVWANRCWTLSTRSLLCMQH